MTKPTETDKATPRPWHMIPTDSERGMGNVGYEIVEPKSYSPIAVIGHDDGAKDDVQAGEWIEADAALIVRAVNAHDELVAVLRQVRINLRAGLLSRTKRDLAHIRMSIGEIDDALAKAEGV